LRTISPGEGIAVFMKTDFPPAISLPTQVSGLAGRVSNAVKRGMGGGGWIETLRDKNGLNARHKILIGG
jgi:hypothetical protein